MTREDKAKLVLPLLLIVSLIIWWPNIKNMLGFSGEKDILKQVSGYQELDVSQFVSLNPLDQNSREVPRSQFNGWARDPFVPDVVPKPQAPPPAKEPESVPKPQPVVSIIEEELDPIIRDQAMDFTLNGIIWHSKRPSAIINDNVYIVGDHMKNSTLEFIDQDQVIMNNGEDDFVLMLQP